MMKYKQVYIVKNPNTDKVYVGSTGQKYISSRLAQHRYEYINGISTSRVTKIFDEGVDETYIELHSIPACECRKDLLKAEGEVIKEFGDLCVNHNRPGRTQAEYRRDNQERYNENQRRWVANNKERFREIQRKYREANREKIREKARERRAKAKQSYAESSEF